ncbi:MAG: hypothetical protein HRU23_05550 [Gammaproteobacteria bacterium]|nr:hypothetical protein [Gammaproteobacteria bacterium]
MPFHSLTTQKFWLSGLLALILGLSALSLMHQAELAHQADEKHHCALYDTINSALIAKSLTLPITTLANCIFATGLFDVYVGSFTPPRARSPPVFCNI